MTSAAKGLAAGLLLLAGLAWAAAPPPPKQEIAKAIKQLGDDEFDVRQKASDLLRAAGRSAEPALEEAAKSGDAEVSRRAREILEDFRWGLYPDLPQAIQEKIRRYRTGDDEEKQKVVQDLLQRGKTGFATLTKIAAREDNSQLRNQIFEELTKTVRQGVVDMLVHGRGKDLDALMEMSIDSERESAYRNYAAWLRLRGQLDGKIIDFKARAAKGGRPAEVLAYLCRAKGDYAGARWAAEKSGETQLLQTIVREAGDWKELAPLYDKENAGEEQGIEKVTHAIAYQRLAGNTAELDKALAKLKKMADDRLDDSGYVWLAAKALFFNDHSTEALALLQRGKNYPPAIEVLAFQGKFKEALELAQKGGSGEDGPAVRMSEVRVRYMLGQTEPMLALLKKLGDEVEKREVEPMARDLLQLEVRYGLKDQAIDYCARLLVDEGDQDKREALLGAVFGDQGGTAAAWWTVLRHQHTADQAGAILKRLRRLLDGKMSAQELDELIKHADEVGATLTAERASALWQAVADVAVGKPDVQTKYLEKAAEKATSTEPLLRLGDLVAEQKKWKEAAERYRQAWAKDTSQPLPLFLQGWAMAQSGEQAEGRKLMEAAHWLPLGDENVRYQFARALSERGQADDARRERELILAVGAAEGWAVNETLRILGHDAQLRKEFRRSADLYEQFRLRCLKTHISFVEFSAHVQIPALLHQTRARALVAEGKIDEAKKEWTLCLEEMPGNVDVPIQLVADLEKAGHKPDAEELFAQVWKTQQQLCRDYPQSATNHNTLAWLGALCRRHLDAAEEHANTAVKLTPDNAGYLDTLAEVNFQRGNSARAKELMQRCIQLEPKNDYFRKQLKRIEAGNPRAEVPDEG